MDLIPRPDQVVRATAKLALRLVRGVGRTPAARPAAAPEPAATKSKPDAIGANPSRRYGSAASRSLAPK
jgi:hypothetical protein